MWKHRTPLEVIEELNLSNTKRDHILELAQIYHAEAYAEYQYNGYKFNRRAVRLLISALAMCDLLSMPYIITETHLWEEYKLIKFEED